MITTNRIVPPGALTTSGNGSAPGGEMGLEDRLQAVQVKVFTGGVPKGSPAHSAMVETEDKPEDPPEKKFTGMSPGLAKFAQAIKLPK